MSEIEGSSSMAPEGESKGDFRERLKSHLSSETLENVIAGESLDDELRKVREYTPNLQELFWIGLTGETAEEKMDFEGKLYLPARSNGEVVIYEPGGPGNIDQFEEKFIPKLVESGYSVFTDRHNGALASNNNVIHSPERIRSTVFGRLLGGENQRGMRDWLNQPATAANIFSSSFEKISFVAHSFGCLDVLVSLKRMEQSNNPTLSKVKRAVLGSWAIDTISPDYKLRGLKPPLSDFPVGEIWGNWAQEMRSQGIYDIDSHDAARAIEEGVGELSNDSRALPKNVTYVFSTPTNDEVVDTENFPNLQKKIKGIFISDESQKSLTEEQMAHDQPRTEPKNLLRVLRWEHPGRTHVARVKKEK